MRVQKFCAILALALPGFVATPAISAPTGLGATSPPNWYTVEVLIFRYTEPGAALGETWPAQVSSPPVKGAVYPPAVATGPYAMLTRMSGPITNAENRLANTAEYAPVRLLGWRQPATTPNMARAVSFAPLPVSTTGPAPAPVPGPQPAPSGKVQVTGTATLLVINRKPALALNLRLCEPRPPGLVLQPPPMATEVATMGAAAAVTRALPQADTVLPPQPRSDISPPGQQCFLLRQRAMLTPGQLQYFDNPAFGVLALVTPIEPPS